MNATLPRRLAAEALGTAALLVMVVGSGIMAAQLSQGNGALALLANAIATGTGLYVLILIFAPVSGAHFNPLVTLAAALRGQLAPRDAVRYSAAQIMGALSGVLLAHAMFEQPLWQVSTQARHIPGLWLAEGIASFGLLTVIACTRRLPVATTAAAVAAYITSAYWFTASTAFANPAATLARAFTDTFTGIRPEDTPAFVLAQFVGALVAVRCGRWLFGPQES